MITVTDFLRSDDGMHWINLGANFVLFLTLLLFLRAVPHAARRWEKIHIAGSVIYFLYCTTVFGYVMVPWLFTRYQSEALAALSNPYTTIIVGCIAVGTYWLRCVAILDYGIIEIMVGISVISFSVSTKSDVAISKIIAIIGGIYVLVRGLDNVDKGLNGWISIRLQKLGKLLAHRIIPSEGPVQSERPSI
jgi:hypothetical protein